MLFPEQGRSPVSAYSGEADQDSGMMPIAVPG